MLTLALFSLWVEGVGGRRLSARGDHILWSGLKSIREHFGVSIFFVTWIDVSMVTMFQRVFYRNLVFLSEWDLDFIEFFFQNLHSSHIFICADLISLVYTPYESDYYGVRTFGDFLEHFGAVGTKSPTALVNENTVLAK